MMPKVIADFKVHIELLQLLTAIKIERGRGKETGLQSGI